jgi:hypothetical protein
VVVEAMVVVEATLAPADMQARLVANPQAQALLVKVLLLADHTKVLLLRVLVLAGFPGLAVAPTDLQVILRVAISKKTKIASDLPEKAIICIIYT